MSTKTEQMLELILKRLERIEKAVAANTAPTAESGNGDTGALAEKLSRLTIKRHAVLTATLGGLGYQQIATIMQCDVTTVKMHLKATLQLLDVASRSILLVSHKTILDFIADKEYEKRYGISKTWWLEQKPELMAVLRSTKPVANQYTRS